MSVIYKKSIFDKHKYIEFYTFDDYYLWVRLLKNNYNLQNLDNILVHARIGNGMISKRRHGFMFFYYDFKLQIKFLRIKHINYFQFLFNIFFRGIPRILPKFLLEFIYFNFLRLKVKSL